MRELFKAASIHFGTGRLDEAEDGFRRVPAGDAQHPGALYFLGVAGGRNRFRRSRTLPVT
jgi:hypothetical protein